MVRKVILPAVILIFLLFGFLLAARLLVGGGEDTWICSNGEWVRHGAPRAPKPTGDCGSGKITVQTGQPPKSVDNQTLEQRLQTLGDHLHAMDSGPEAKKLFPDLTPIFKDSGHGNPQIPRQILPLTYYYSREADTTVSICNINQTVFICPGKLDRLIQPKDFNNCQVTKEYLQLER